MTLDKRPIEGGETVINGKKWKELKLDEAIERYKKMDDDKIETGSRAINKDHKGILTDLKWEYKNNGINKSVLLGTIITLGASRMETFVEAGRDIYMKLRKIDNAFVDEVIRSNLIYLTEPSHYPYPYTTYKWVNGIISDLSDIFRYGVHSVTDAAFYYGLKEDTEVLSIQEYKNLVNYNVKRFQERIDGRILLYKMLIKTNEEITQNVNK
ncbi:hypothetical protein KAX02_07980 [candidate division WOR-3 bacterium]|nr:hypothetical protein [candidate division WOR-3 bacterium]